jgi:hypothetical protein
LSGVLSLIASFDRPGGERSQRLLTEMVSNPAVTTGDIIRNDTRNAMEQQDSIDMVGHPVARTIVSRLVPGSESIDVPSLSRNIPQSQPEPLWINGLLNDIEDMIQQYPWPTVILGIGAGYLLARRVR